MHRTRHRSEIRGRFRAENFCMRRNIRSVEPSKIPVPQSLCKRFEFPTPFTEWRKKVTINIGQLQPIVALVAGVLILIMPRLLNYIVALYLILIGILGLGIIK